jgi:hypothetical protein
MTRLLLIIAGRAQRWHDTDHGAQRKPYAYRPTCPVCGRRSNHPDDHRAGYCGRCHDYTMIPMPAAERPGPTARCWCCCRHCDPGRNPHRPNPFWSDTMLITESREAARYADR